MKRFIAMWVLILMLLCSCKPNNIPKQEITPTSSGMWLTYNEINEMLVSSDGFATELDRLINSCKELSIENIYIHVRSYCDSLFKSRYFPLINNAQGHDFDVFKFMIDAFHQNGINVHAWINPYRVLTSSEDIEKLSSESPAYKWLKDEDEKNDVNVCFSNGIYLNPAEAQVQRLILDGIKEILENYDVDGIHFDDYFYPTTEESFDKKSYEQYCASTGKPLSLAEWRCINVNLLISNTYSTVKAKNPNIMFTVSPAASIEDNVNKLYADVEEWVREGYIDAVIPQLYFGFEYPQKDFCFEELLKEWTTLAETNNNVELLIGLGSYKIGTDSENDRSEWNKNDDIIARQAEICYKNSMVNGYVIFSYTSLFSNEMLNTAQRQNLKTIIESCRITKGDTA